MPKSRTATSPLPSATTPSASQAPREQYPTLIGLSQKERRRAVRIRNRSVQRGEPFTEAELDEMEEQWQATQSKDAREGKPKA